MLALALNENSIPCRIYEARYERDRALGSGVSIAPNGCRVLDRLGILERIAPKSYQTEYQVIKDAAGRSIRRVNIANPDIYGYKTYRLYRHVLLDELRIVLNERKIHVEYGAKFERIVEETAYGVTFLVNGEIKRASLLIGADGIHSAVRRYISPQLPEYTGIACVYGHLPAGSIQWPTREFEKACTIQDDPGVLFMGPEVADGSELLVGRQFAYQTLDRTGWEALETDKSRLCSLFCKDYEGFQQLAKSIMDQISARKEGLLLWPYYRMPKLERWSSILGHIIIIGDAAHAIPPSSGQGVNQAFEDAHTLALLLGSLSRKTELKEALDFWYHLRQTRIDAVVRKAQETDILRLTRTERLLLKQRPQSESSQESQSTDDEMKWLYMPTTDDEITAWIRVPSQGYSSE